MDFAIKSMLPPSGGNSSSSNVIDQDPAKMIEDFAKLLVAQITNQDPEAPMDPTQIITQNSQLTASLGTVRLANQMAHYQQVASTMAAIGQTAFYTDPVTQATNQGIVAGANFSTTPPTLSINGDDIPMDNILGIGQPNSSDAQTRETAKLSQLQMLGKTVEYFDAGNNLTTGVVDDADMISTSGLVTIAGASVPLTKITRVFN